MSTITSRGPCAISSKLLVVGRKRGRSPPYARKRSSAWRSSPIRAGLRRSRRRSTDTFGNLIFSIRCLVRLCRPPASRRDIATDATRRRVAGIYDWELVALQRRFQDCSDTDLRQIIENKFWDMMCDAKRDTIFYVGNQQAHPRGFIVLGVAYPERPKPGSRS